MRLVGKNQLEKLKKKNKGNVNMVKAIDKLIDDIEQHNWNDPPQMKAVRSDADCVHGEGFYFFDISIHRAMLLIEFDEDGEATVVWTGTHQEYEQVFRNNKNTINKWLKANNWI